MSKGQDQLDMLLSCPAGKTPFEHATERLGELLKAIAAQRDEIERLANAKKSIQQDIDERSKELKEWRDDLRNRPDSDDLQLYKQERSFRDGLRRALDYLNHAD